MSEEKDEYYLAAAKHKCEKDHLFFMRYFFKQRMGSKFLVNWHHRWIADEIDDVLSGKTQNIIFNVAPGSSKTEQVVIALIARGLALNPMARFLHLSYSDQLAVLNSQVARDIVRSDEFQQLWPLEIAEDTKAKKRWNVMVDGRKGGGVYATSLSGQVTGFRAGHMAEGFQGAIIIDDPLKPEDVFSPVRTEAANRQLLTTVKSRRAKPDTPIILIMQRLGELDPTGFVEKGGLQGQGSWKIVRIPALIDDAFIGEHVPEKYWGLIDSSVQDEQGRYSYWEFKEPLRELVEMESGMGTDRTGNLISKHVFSSQYQQRPVALGGNVIKGKDFVRYTVLPKIMYRKMYADTAQKTKEHNDWSVFQVWGYGIDAKIYLLDQLRGKWTSPHLKREARAFWAKHAALEKDSGPLAGMGALREMMVEDKASGTDLIQTFLLEPPVIPVKAIQRNTDKYTRVMDALPYIEAQQVCIPESAPFTSDFIGECEAFKADMTHAHDDQIDPMLDAVQDMLSNQNKLKIWEQLGG
jgi:predicted phage terminase large subunit-like protein